MIQKAAFAIGILSNIYEFHLYTRNSAFLYHTLAKSFDCSSEVKLRDFTTNFLTPTNSLSPVIPNYARSLRITAAAGTKLAGPSYSGTVIFFPDERALQPKGLLHSRGIAASEFPPLCNIPYCCLP